MMTPKELEKLFKSINHFDDFLGLKLTIDEQGQTEYRLEVHQGLMSSPAAAHGGPIAAMMDATLGIQALCYAASKNMLCATVEFKINFLASATLGETLVGQATLDSTGKRLVVASASIIEAKSGRLIAKGMGTFNLYPIEKRSDVNPESVTWS